MLVVRLCIIVLTCAFIFIRASRLFCLHFIALVLHPSCMYRAFLVCAFALHRCCLCGGIRVVHARGKFYQGFVTDWPPDGASIETCAMHFTLRIAWLFASYFGWCNTNRVMHHPRGVHEIALHCLPGTSLRAALCIVCCMHCIILALFLV